MDTLITRASRIAMPGEDSAHTVQLLYELSSKAWSLGGLFFGLWLIPMGGVGYIGNAFIGSGVDGTPSWLVEGLTIPATIGEFWMIGFLLAIGCRTPTPAPTTPHSR